MRRAAALLSVVLAVLAVVAAAHARRSDVHLNLVAYSTPREAYAVNAGHSRHAVHGAFEHRADLVVGVRDVMAQWIQAFFWLTNGTFTTVAGTARPRMSTSTPSPGASDGGTKAKAMPCSSMGEKLPLVTSPAGLPSTRTA